MGHIKKRAYIKKSIEQRIESAHQKGCLLLAQSMPAAIAKLLDLPEDEHSETARKASVDLIKLELAQTTSSAMPAEETDLSESFNGDAAERVLRVLAERGE